VVEVADRLAPELDISLTKLSVLRRFVITTRSGAPNSIAAVGAPSVRER
jgi:hypothetical protein